MGEVVTTKIDEKGRLVVPKQARQLLGIDGEEAIVRAEIEVRQKAEADA